jgi:molybdate transport system substrate-binding protein
LISYSFFAQIAGNKLGGRALVTTRRYLLRLIAVAVVGFCLTPSLARDESKGPLVFAAASLKDALDAINAAWSKESGKSAVISYAGSSVLAKQIEESAPADVFISADLNWMDYLAKRNLIKPDTRFNLLGNTLVLIAPKDSSLEAKIVPDFPLAALIGDGKLAMANTESVPAGKYGKAALTKLGIWDSVKDKIAQAENVRAALLLVSRGEAPLGIVYATDARIDIGVKVIGTFPDGSHPPIAYPVAATADAKPEAARYLAFLRTSSAKGIFEAYGFSFLIRPTS